MTGLYDPRETETLARQNIAPGSPAGYGENFDAAWEDTVRSNQSVSARRGIFEAYDRYVRGIEEKTGEKLFNPAEVWQPGGRRDEVLAKHEQRLFDKLADVKKRFPDIEVRTPADIREEVAKERLTARQARAKVGARSSGFAAGLGEFLGEAGAAVVDPPVLLSMFAGAPLASGILRTALIEAGIAGAVEIPIQIGVQNDRRQFGEQPSFDEGVANVLAATAGGAIFGGGMRAAFVGTRKLIETARASESVLPRQARDALSFLSRKQEMEDQNPFIETPDGQRAHAERYSGATEALRTGRVADVEGEPAPQFSRREITDSDSGVRAFDPGEAGAEIEDTMRRLAGDASDDAQSFARVRAAARPPSDATQEAVPANYDLAPSTAQEHDLYGWRPSKGAKGFVYSIRRDGETVGFVDVSVFPDGRARIEDIVASVDGQGFSNALGPRAVRSLLSHLREMHPEINKLTGERVSGARKGGKHVFEGDGQEMEFALPDTKRSPASDDTLSPDGDEGATPIRTGTARTIADARVEQERMRSGEIDKEDHILESSLRADLADRMDETVMVEDVLGEIRPMTIREIFDEFDEDEALMREFLDCAGLGS